MVTGVPAAQGAQGGAAARASPKKTSILFEKGVIWSGTQNDAVMNSYANLALLLGSIGRPGPGVRPPGRPPERLHVRLRLAAPAGRRRPAQPLAGAREGHDRLLIFAICNPLRMQQQTTQLRQFTETRRRSSSTSTSARRTSRRSPTSCCPRPPGASTPTRARTSSAGCASTSSSTTRPARCMAEYLIFARIAQRLAPSTGSLDPAEWQFAAGRTSSTAMRADLRGQGGRHRQDHAQATRVARHQRHPGADHAARATS